MKVSSSNSSSHFDSLLYSSKNERTSGCYIAKVVRRILCINDHPSSPFNHFKEEERENLLETPSAGLGLVARLMGLDTVPAVEPVVESLSENSDDLIKKSRSSRRTIIPTFQELEDDKFFILSFDHVKNEEFPFERWRSHSDSAKKIITKSKKRRTRRDCTKENEGAKKVSEENFASKVSELHVHDNSSNVRISLTNSCRKPYLSERIIEMKGKQSNLAVFKFEAECDHENSSPNSVFDFVELADDHSESTSSGDTSRFGNAKMRTLLEELQNYDKSGGKCIEDISCEKDKGKRLKNQNPDYAEYWDEIGELVAREMMKSSWLEGEIPKSCHLEEIGTYLASEIVGQLLEELLL